MTTAQIKNEAKRTFGPSNGYSGIGFENGKVIVYVTDSNSDCGKAKIPPNLLGKVEIKRAKKN